MPIANPSGKAVHEQDDEDEQAAANAGAAESAHVHVAAGKQPAGDQQEGDSRRQPSAHRRGFALLERRHEQADDGRERHEPGREPPEQRLELRDACAEGEHRDSSESAGQRGQRPEPEEDEQLRDAARIPRGLRSTALPFHRSSSPVPMRSARAARDARDVTPHVVIAGGGVGALEGLLALQSLAGDRIRISVLTASRHLTYRALSVAEPFGGDPAPRHEWSASPATVGSAGSPTPSKRCVPTRASSRPAMVRRSATTRCCWRSARGPGPHCRGP